LINGALPLYVGPDLSKAGLPENLAIQIKQSDTTIQQVTDEISRDLAEKILSTGREFILSETFRTNFSSEFVFKDMSIKIKKYINTNWNKIKEL
jgi:hypothetical protein